MIETSSRQWIKKYPIVSFVFFTYLLTTVTWALLLSIFGRIPIEELIGKPSAVLLVYIGAGAPTVIAVVLTYITNGVDGLSKLRKRVFNFRVGYSPWLAALGIPFLCALGAAAIYTEFSNDLGNIALPSWYDILPPSALLLFLAGPLCEETGWRGYLQPHLLKTFTPLKSALLIGIIWCFWHIPLSLTPGTTPALDHPTAWVQYLVSTIATSVLIMIIVVRAQGSVATAMVFHWASNAALSEVVMPMFPSANNRAWEEVELIQVGLLLLFATILLILPRKNGVRVI